MKLSYPGDRVAQGPTSANQKGRVTRTRSRNVVIDTCVGALTCAISTNRIPDPLQQVRTLIRVQRHSHSFQSNRKEEGKKKKGRQIMWTQQREKLKRTRFSIVLPRHACTARRERICPMGFFLHCSPYRDVSGRPKRDYGPSLWRVRQSEGIELSTAWIPLN